MGTLLAPPLSCMPGTPTTLRLVVISLSRRAPTPSPSRDESLTLCPPPLAPLAPVSSRWVGWWGQGHGEGGDCMSMQGGEVDPRGYVIVLCISLHIYPVLPLWKGLACS